MLSVADGIVAEYCVGWPVAVDAVIVNGWGRSRLEWHAAPCASPYKRVNLRAHRFKHTRGLTTGTP